MTDLITMQNLTIFVLAIFVGYHVVWTVPAPAAPYNSRLFSMDQEPRHAYLRLPLR